MSAPKSRTRCVSFKLTEEEYEECVAYCKQMGVSTISDVARFGLDRLIFDSKPSQSLPLADYVGDLLTIIHSLEAKMRRLREMTQDD